MIFFAQFFLRPISALSTPVVMTIMTLMVAVFTPVTSAHAASISSAVADHQSNVMFIRHALAPGYGDPDDFDIHDCSTQRNLDDEGRRQARELGQMIAASGLKVEAVLSSQWCRCQDTATEMAIGPHRVHPGLNSFFEGHVDRAVTLTLLRDYLATLPKDKMVVMITHQVVIQAITGLSTRSGGIVLYNTGNGEAKRYHP